MKNNKKSDRLSIFRKGAALDDITRKAYLDEPTLSTVSCYHRLIVSGRHLL